MLRLISLGTLCLMLTSPLEANPINGDISSTYYQLGLEFSSSRDDLLIPLAFHGPGVILGLGHKRTYSQWTVDLPLRFKFDFVFNRFSHPGVLLSLDVNPRTMRTVPWPFLGGHFETGIELPFKMNNQFIFSWDDAHLYWFTTRGINLALAWGKDWKSRNTSIELSIPLLTWISRPESYRYEKQDASLNWLGFRSPEEKRKYDLASYNDYQAFTLNIIHSNTEKAGKWMLGIDYDHYRLPKDVWVLSTTLSYHKSFGTKGDKK